MVKDDEDTIQDIGRRLEAKRKREAERKAAIKKSKMSRNYSRRRSKKDGGSSVNSGSNASHSVNNNHSLNIDEDDNLPPLITRNNEDSDAEQEAATKKIKKSNNHSSHRSRMDGGYGVYNDSVSISSVMSPSNQSHEVNNDENDNLPPLVFRNDEEDDGVAGEQVGFDGNESPDGVDNDSIVDSVRIAVEDVYSDSDDDVCLCNEDAIPLVFETPVSNSKGATTTSKEKQNKRSDGGCVVEDGSDGVINLSVAFQSRKKRILLSDLIQCKLPIEPESAEKYAKEVLDRLKRCIQRGQLDEAMSVVDRGIACLMMSHVSNSPKLAELFCLRYQMLNMLDADAKEDRYNNAEFTVGSLEMDKKYTLMNIRRYSNYDRDPRAKLKNVLLAFHPELEELSVLDRVRHYERALRNEINCIPRSVSRAIISETLRRKKENEELSSPHITVGKLNKLLTETRFANIYDENEKDDLCCQNCNRHNAVSDDPSSVYFFDLYKVYSDDISTQSPLRMVTSSSNRNDATELLLCTECMQFLHKYTLCKNNKSWEYCWPSFFWNLLTGSEAVSGTRFCTVYEPSMLWRFIPETLRTYWRESLVNLNAWEFICTDTEPSSYFNDRTVDIEKFHCDIKSYTMKKTLSALDPNRNRRPGSPLIKPMMIPDVLCPWGCSEFAFRSEGIDACLIIQHHLPKVILNMPLSSFEKFHLVDSSRYDFIRLEEEEADYVLMNDDWPIRPTMMWQEGKGMLVCTCRHHGKAHTQRRLYNHPARKLCKLSSIYPDDISFAKLRPTSIRTVRKGKFNTSPSSFIQNHSYAGIDSADIEINSSGSIVSKGRLTAMHRAEIMNRDDIRLLGEKYVAEGRMAKGMYDSILSNRDDFFSERTVDLLSRAASGTPVYNSAVLQQAATNGNKVRVWLYDKKKKESYLTLQPRSWDPIIYNSQVNDPIERYGTRMKPVNKLSLSQLTDKDIKDDILKEKTNSDNAAASVMLYVLLGIVTGCKELYHAIDSKAAHSFDDWSGYLLAFIHSDVMKHSDRTNQGTSPFSKSPKALLMTLLKFVPISHVRNGAGFVCDPLRFTGFFSQHHYPRICISNGVFPAPENIRDDNDIVIVVSSSRPTCHGFERSGDRGFEARTIIAIKECVEKRHEFEAVRYSRHGGGYSEWWVQQRMEGIMKRYDMESLTEDCEDHLPYLPEDQSFYVVVYVDSKQKVVRDYEDMLRNSIVGNDFLHCACDMKESPVPFVATHRYAKERQTCSLKSCRKKEKYVCQSCGYKVCSSCFDELTLIDNKRSHRVINEPDSCMSIGVNVSDDDTELRTVTEGMRFPPTNCISLNDVIVHDVTNDGNGLFSSFLYALSSQNDSLRIGTTCGMMRDVTMNYLRAHMHDSVGPFTLQMLAMMQYDDMNKDVCAIVEKEKKQIQNKQMSKLSNAGGINFVSDVRSVDDYISNMKVDIPNKCCRGGLLELELLSRVYSTNYVIYSYKKNCNDCNVWHCNATELKGGTVYLLYDSVRDTYKAITSKVVLRKVRMRNACDETSNDSQNDSGECPDEIHPDDMVS